MEDLVGKDGLPPSIYSQSPVGDGTSSRGRCKNANQQPQVKSKFKDEAYIINGAHNSSKDSNDDLSSSISGQSEKLEMGPVAAAPLPPAPQIAT